MNIKKTSNRKKITFVVFALAAIAACGVLVWKFSQRNDDTSHKDGEYVINMNKSDAEKKRTEELQKNPEEKMQNNQSDAPPQPSVSAETGKQQANVLLTNAGVFNNKVSASGFVTNLVESDGTCEYVFTKGNEVVRKRMDTLQNPTSTTCKTTTFSSSELSAGTWSVYVQYTSSKSSGTSNTKEFTV